MKRKPKKEQLALLRILVAFLYPNHAWKRITQLASRCLGSSLQLHKGLESILAVVNGKA